MTAEEQGHYITVVIQIVKLLPRFKFRGELNDTEHDMLMYVTFVSSSLLWDIKRMLIRQILKQNMMCSTYGRRTCKITSYLKISSSLLLNSIRWRILGAQHQFELLLWPPPTNRQRMRWFDMSTVNGNIQSFIWWLYATNRGIQRSTVH